MSRQQDWVDQLVLEEGIDNTRILSREVISNWCKEYNETFHTDVTEESFKRMLRKSRWGTEQKEPSVIKEVETERVDVGNVLIIGDLHLPFTLQGYREFCKEMQKKHKCKTVVFAGDLVDNHYSSFWNSDPDAHHSAGGELDKVKENIQLWYKDFPNALVLYGNHDLIPQRKVFNAGLSKQWLRPLSEVLDTPNWEYAEEFVLDNVIYTHGTGRKARQRMSQDLVNIVIGHYHSESYIDFLVGKDYRLFAMQVGCGIERKSFAFAYGKAFAKPHINCGIIKDNGKLPIIEYMDLDKDYTK